MAVSIMENAVSCVGRNDVASNDVIATKWFDELNTSTNVTTSSMQNGKFL